MKKLLLLAAALVLALVALTARPKPSECAFCFTGRCLDSSICGSGCVCVKFGLDQWGRCATIEE